MQGIRFTEWLDYSDEETRRWKRWFSENPAALDLAIDIAGTGTVRKLLLHIFFVERHFATLVSGGSLATSDHLRSEIENNPPADLGQIFTIGEEASREYRKFLERATEADLSTVLNLGTKTEIRGSKRKLITQALTHSVRHWAQLATLLRQKGFTQDWVHDFLLSKAME